MAASAAAAKARSRRFMLSSRAVMSNWRPIGEDAWHLPLSLEEGRDPRQAGLLALDRYRWTPSQGHGFSVSRRRLPGYSDGSARDSQRLPLPALVVAPVGVLY